MLRRLQQNNGSPLSRRCDSGAESTRRGTIDDDIRGSLDRRSIIMCINREGSDGEKKHIEGELSKAHRD